MQHLAQELVQLVDYSWSLFYLLQRVTKDLALKQTDQATLFKFLQVGEIATTLGIDPRKIDGIGLLDQKPQRGLSTRERLLCAQIEHFACRFFRRDCKLRNTNKF